MENETRAVLAANIKTLVAGRGIGVLAKTIGIGTGTLQRAVSGDGAVRVDTLGKLAKLYGSTTDALLWEDALTLEAIRFAVEFDALSARDRRCFQAMWRGFFAEAKRTLT